MQMAVQIYLKELFFNIVMSGNWNDWNELIKILTQQRVHWEGLILQGDDFLIYMSMVAGMTEHLWNWIYSKVKYKHRIIE